MEIRKIINSALERINSLRNNFRKARRNLRSNSLVAAWNSVSIENKKTSKTAKNTPETSKKEEKRIVYTTPKGKKRNHRGKKSSSISQKGARKKREKRNSKKEAKRSKRGKQKKIKFIAKHRRNLIDLQRKLNISSVKIIKKKLEEEKKEKLEFLTEADPFKKQIEETLSTINSDDWNDFHDTRREFKAEEHQLSLELANPDFDFSKIGGRDPEEYIRSIKAEHNFKLTVEAFNIALAKFKA